MYFTDRLENRKTVIFWSVKLFFEVFWLKSRIWVKIYQRFSARTHRSAKWPFSGWSVKYTILAGGKKNWPHAPKSFVEGTSHAKFELKILKWQKVRGGPILRGAKLMTSSGDDDVMIGDEFFSDTLWKLHEKLLSLSNVIENFPSGERIIGSPKNNGNENRGSTVHYRPMWIWIKIVKRENTRNCFGLFSLENTR